MLKGKRFLSYIVLLFLLLSNLQIGVLYADEVSKLNTQKEKSISNLEKVEILTDKVVTKIDKKIKNKEVKERLEDKQEEIKKYLEKTKEKIEGENSKTDIKKLTLEAKQIVVLKVVSGITKQIDIEEKIPNNVASTRQEKKQALETISDSMERGDDYSLIISTKYSEKKSLDLFHKFDKNIKLDFLYNDGRKNIFEVFIPKKSIFSQEILEDLKNGNIPEKFLGIKIITPEVFNIENEVGSAGLQILQKSQINLTGENLSKTWGVEKFTPNSYLSKLKTLNKKIKVGIIDTGIDYNHPELKGRVSHGRDFVNKDEDAIDDQGHGTHVAGTIGAGINGSGIIGVNPFVEFVPLKICNSRGFCPSYAVIKALDYAKTQNLDVVNMSLGGRGNPNSNPICAGIKELDNVGTIVVAASGNSNIDTSNFIPGGCAEAITVAAVDNELYRAGFSNYGNKVDVSAPGVGIYSTLPNNRYRKLSGTSMATPHIVGLVSVMKSFDKTLNSKKVKKLFKENQIEASYESGKYIAGFPDVEMIIKELQNNDTSTTPAKPLSGILTPSQEQGVTKLAQTGSLDEEKNEAEIDSSLKFEEEDNDEDDFTIPELEKLILKNTEYINLFETGTGVKINNIEDFDEKNIISEEIKENLDSRNNSGIISTEKVQYFNASGVINSDEIKINSLEEDEGEEVIGKSFSGANLPEFEEENFEEIKSTTEQIQDIDSTEKKETQEFFIDGAEKGVKINSVGDEKLEEIKIEEYSTGTINNEKIFDDNGNEIDFTQLEKVNIQEEKFENIDFKHTEELLIDGAEAGVKINSFGEKEKLPEPLKINEYSEIENISSFSGTEDLGDKLENGKIEIEKLEKYNEELFIDGAEVGVEINSIGEEELQEIEILKSGSGVVKEEIIEELTPEQKKELESFQEENLIFTGSTENIEIPEEYKKFIINDEDLSKEEIEKIKKEKVEINEFNKEELEEIKQEESGIKINSLEDDFNKNRYYTIKQTIKIKELDTFTYRFMGYFFNYQIPDNKGGIFSKYRKSIHFKPNKPGTYYIKASPKYKGYRYSWLFKIIVEPLPSIEKEIFKGQTYFGGGFKRVQIIKNIESAYVYSILRSGYKVYGRKVGTSYIRVQDYYNPKYVYILKLTIKEPPKPKEYNIKVEEGEFVDVHLPAKGIYTIQYFNNEKGGYAYVYGNNENIKIKGDTYGKIKYKVLRNGVYTYTLNIIVTPKIEKYNEKIFNTQKKYIRLSRKIYIYGYELSSNKDGIIGDIKKYRYGFYYTAKKAGEVEIYIKSKLQHVATYKIKVEEIPKPKEYNITVEEGKYSNIYFPESFYYNIKLKGQKTGNASVYNYYSQRKIKIKGISGGKITYYINDKNNILRYILNIKIIPKPPKIINKELYETRALWISYRGNKKISQNNKNIQLYYNYRGIQIKALKPGNTDIYIKDYKNNLVYIYKIKVLPKPKVKIYNYYVNVGARIKINLPVEISNYNISFDNSWNFERNYFYGYKSAFDLNTKRIGKSTIYLNEKHGNKWLRYQINLNIVPFKKYFTLEQGECLPVRETRDINYYKTNGKAYISSRKFGSEVRNRGYRSRCIYGKEVGKTELNGKHRKYGLKEKWYITIKPRKQIQTLTCNTTIGKTCYFKIQNDGYRYKESRANVFEARARSSYIKIDAKKSGTATIYINSYYGNFYTHRINIVVKAKDPKIYNVILPVGIDKVSKWGASYDSSIKFRATKSGMVSLFHQKINRYSRLKFTAKQEGNVDINIYKDGDLVGIIKLKIIPKLEGIKVDKHIFQKVGETKTINYQIRKGAGDYKLSDYNKEVISASINSKGEITIKGKKSGKTWLRIVDKYNQYLDLKIQVKPVSLSVSTSDRKIKLNKGEKYLVAIYDYYGTISLKRSNNNISIYFKKGENGTDYIEVTVLKGGESVFEIKDSRGDSVSVEVNGGEKVEEKENKEEIKNTEDENKKENDNDEKKVEEELEKELKKLFEEWGIEGVEINSLQEEGIKINEAFHLKYYSEKKYVELWDDFSDEINKIIIPILKKKYEIKNEELFKKLIKNKIILFRNKYYKDKEGENVIDNIDAMNSLYKKYTKKILDLQILNKRLYLKPRQNKINLLIKRRDAYYMSYKKAVTLYWNAHPDEKIEYEEAIRQFYIDSALDISGLGDIGKSIGDLSAYWVGKIKEDKALMELGGNELNGDLKALALLASPGKKFKKMLAIEKKIGRLKTLLKIKNIKVNGFKDLDRHFKEHGKDFYGVNSKAEYQRKAIDFLKNREGKDIKVWTRGRDGTIFKLDTKTGVYVNIHKNGKIGTFHKSDDFLKNPENFINKNN